MKIHADTRSAFVTVECEPEDVQAFARSWPCFNGPDRVRFTFQRATGDLVDMEPADLDSGAAVALSEDAWEYFEAHAEPEPPETFRAWLCATLDADQLADLARYGADAGWPGLTYTTVCVELFDRYTAEIRAALEEDAEAFGYDSPDALVATFRRSDMLWSEDGRKNLLVWYMAERTAREMTDY